MNVLQIMNSLNCGGEETFVMNLYRTIDRDKIRFFFLVGEMKSQKHYFEEEIRSSRDIIFKIPSKSRNPIQNFYQTYQIVKKNNFKVVHRHSDNSMMFLDLLAAKLGGAKVLVSHSHSSDVTSRIDRLLHCMLRPFLNGLVKNRIACSKTAGKWMYHNKQFKIVNNAIDTNKFVYNEGLRKSKRAFLELNNRLVIGHIGRFSPIKNHKFIIEIFAALQKLVGYTATLILIGQGELKLEIEKLVLEYKLQKYVIFAGQQSNINEWLQIMDVVLFPSIYEGLPVSLIEAQASGTRCVISDTISKEVKITPLVRFVSLKKNSTEWANIILNFSNYEKSDMKNQIVKAGYDIKSVLSELELIYLKK